MIEVAQHHSKRGLIKDDGRSKSLPSREDVIYRDEEIKGSALYFYRVCDENLPINPRRHGRDQGLISYPGIALYIQSDEGEVVDAGTVRIQRKQNVVVSVPWIVGIADDYREPRTQIIRDLLRI